MARRSRAGQAPDPTAVQGGLPAGPPPAGPPPGGTHDVSLVLTVSLLAGGLVAAPALTTAETSNDLLSALTVMLSATLVALVGFGLVAYLYRKYTAEDEDTATGADTPPGTTPGTPGTPGSAVIGAVGPGTGAAGDGPVPTVAVDGLEGQDEDIDAALAPTDALLQNPAASR